MGVVPYGVIVAGERRRQNRQHKEFAAPLLAPQCDQNLEPRIWTTAS
jgi:hypothetical protein